MSIGNLLMEKIAAEYQAQMAKTAMIAETNQSTGIVQLDWAEALALYGNDETPIISSIAKVPCKAITHRWREATHRAAAANTSAENAAAKSEVSVTPAPVTNTCQILKGTVGVSGSAIQEARNGVVGSDLSDMVSWQLESEIVGIMKDLESAVLFGVESTSTPRAMKGIVGLLGTWNGFVQTTCTSVAAAFSQTALDSFLNSIWGQQAGFYPDTIYCSLAAAQKINGYTSDFRVNISMTDLASLTAGQRVIKYVAPWGGIMDIVPHPLCLNAATAGDNWLLAARKDHLALADFRPLFTHRLPVSTDGEDWEVLYEGTLECKVEKAFGILRNFTQI